MADTERTERATPHRRREAREKGQVAKSSEVNTAVVLLSSFLALRFLSKYIFANLEIVMRSNISNMTKVSFTPEGISKYALESLFYFGLMALPFILIVALCAGVSNFLQVGFLHSSQVLKPQLSRINPINGLKRIFSYRIFIDLVKSAIKIGITASIAYFTIKAAISRIIFAIELPPLQSIKMIGLAVFQLGFRISLAFVALGIIDYLYQRWEYEKSLRMTRQEIKEELIRYEGRPEVKQRIRTMQRQLAMRRMMQEVRRADVVITNPITLAIALRYDPKEMIAPKVVAKGARLIAEKIVAIAKENNIPVIENAPLARMLFKLVEVGQMIPLALYQAVADVLAYVWRIGKLKRRWF